MPRIGYGSGSVSCSCPVGSTTTGTLILATASDLESVALNVRGVPADEVVPHGLGLINSMRDTQGDIVLMLRIVPCF